MDENKTQVNYIGKLDITKFVKLLSSKYGAINFSVPDVTQLICKADVHDYKYKEEKNNE